MNTPAFSRRRLGQRVLSRACARLTVPLLTAFVVSTLPSARAAVATDIGNLGGSATANAVAPGYVVGQSNARAFVWSAATNSMRDLGALLNSPYSNATGVNSSGEVVGGFYNADFSAATAFYWTQATGFVNISATGNFSQYPLFINESGVVAGNDADGNAFRWSRAGGLQNLGVAGAIGAINARGDIAINAGDRAYIAWGAGGPITTINSPGTNAPPLGAGSTVNMSPSTIQINALNDSGVAVGQYWDFEFIWNDGIYVHNSHAFKWSVAGGVTDLGNTGTWTIPGFPYPVFGATAKAINNSGTIVGISYTSNGGYVGLVFNPGGAPTVLPGLNATDIRFAATGINNDGVIVGYANEARASVMWKQGVLTDLTPSFAPQYPGALLINGSMIAGNGLDNSYTQHAWTFTVPGAPAATLFFTDSLTGPTSPNLAAIPAGKYGYTAAGLQRMNSTGETDRPVVTTGLSSYLTAANFTAEVTVKLANIDILYFGLGQGDPDPGYFGEPDHAFYFRVHSGWQGNTSIQADVRQGTSGNFVVNQIGTYALGSTITLRIVRAGNSVTMSVVGGGSVTYNFAAYPWLGLTNSNTKVFLGNTSVGSVFSNLKIYENPTDTTPPVIAALPDLVREATSAAGAIVTFNATATDDVDGPVAVVATPASGSTFPIATTIVGLAASDAAHNTATASFKVTVRDTTPPALTVSGNVSAEATSAGGAVVSYPAATATDAVTASPVISYSRNSGAQFPLGDTSVNVTATDGANNATTKSFVVSVKDTTAPTLTVPASQTLEATSAAGAVATFAASATDAVTASPSITYSTASGSTFPLGTTTVNVTATDAANNSARGSFAIKVQDTTAPVITSVSGNLVAEATSAAGAAVTYSAATATDAVGVDSLTYSQASGSTFPLGTTTVTVTAKDAAGNSSARSFTVTVRDTTAPTITGLSTNAPSLWPPNHKMVAVTVSATTADAVGVSSFKIVSVTSSEPDNGLGDGDTPNDIEITGNLTVNLRAERSGNGDGRTYTITVEARDQAGNASRKSVTVVVPKNQGGK